MTSFLPGYVSGSSGLGRGGGGGGGRSSSSTTRDRTVTVAAAGALAPVPYGRFRIPGMIFAVGIANNQLVIGSIVGIGPLFAIDDIYLGGAAPATGVTVTKYLGTPDQQVDPDLAAAIPAYNDTLTFETPRGRRGIAYIVIKGNATALPEFPSSISVVGRGRMLYDPRIDATVYSDNTALALADMITDPDYGNGMPAYGVSEAADWCDTEIEAGTPRCRIALTILRGAPTTQYLDLLADHAECLWSFRDDGVSVKPDAPVDLDATEIVDASMIIRDSLQVSADSSLYAPTEVEVQYMIQTDDENEWSLAPAPVAQLAGVASGDVQRIPESVSMEGVYREDEANLKAQAILARKQHVVTVSWQTLGIGATYDHGTVVRIRQDYRGVAVPVRIQSVVMSSPGRWTITGSRYDASHYPSDIIIPDRPGRVPTGAILIHRGETLPAGWEAYELANGRHILGAGGQYPPGESGEGSGAILLTGNTTRDGSHSGSGGTRFLGTMGVVSGGSQQRSEGVADAGGHHHTFEIGEVLPVARARQERLIIRTADEASLVPQSAIVFGLKNLTNAAIQRVFSTNDAILQAHTVSGDITPGSISVTTGYTSDAHNHVGGGSYTIAAGTPNPGTMSTSGGGRHRHTGTLSLAANPLRRALAAYSGMSDYPVIPGMIFLWAGSLDSLPEDFVLCDGTGATPDMRDHFVTLAATGDEGNARGDGTLTANVLLSSVGHQHGLTASSGQFFSAYARHRNEITHNHRIAVSEPWQPHFYALAFLMYYPGR